MLRKFRGVCMCALIVAGMFLSSVIPLKLLSAQSQSSSGPVLTETEAVEIAKSANRQTKRANLDIDRGSMSIREAKSYYFPQTSLSASGGEALGDIHFSIPAGTLGTYSGTGPIPGTGTSITSKQQFVSSGTALVAQPLSQLYKLHLASELARNTEASARLTMRQQQQDITEQVRKVYHQICLLEATVETDRTQQKALEQTWTIVQNQASQGARLAADVLQVKSSLAQESYSLSRDEDAFIDAKERMNVLLGRDLDTAFSVEPLPATSAEEADVAEARRTALQHRPELDLARLQVERANLYVRREKAEYIPDVSAQILYAGFQGIDFLPKNVAVAGFGITWNHPWDWGQRRAETRSLRDASKQKVLSQQETMQQVMLEVDRSLRALKESRLLVAASEAGQQASLERLRNVTDRFNTHSALLSEVLSQSAESREQTENYTRALETYWDARATFDRALGRD